VRRASVVSKTTACSFFGKWSARPAYDTAWLTAAGYLEAVKPEPKIDQLGTNWLRRAPLDDEE